MKNILAATLMIIGAIFISAYTICMAVLSARALLGYETSEYILLLVGGLIAMVVGAVLFYLERMKKQ